MIRVAIHSAHIHSHPPMCWSDRGIQRPPLVGEVAASQIVTVDKVACDNALLWGEAPLCAYPNIIVPKALAVIEMVGVGACIDPDL